MRTFLSITCLAGVLWVNPWADRSQGLRTGAPQIAQIASLLDTGRVEEAAKISRTLIADPLADFVSLVEVGRIMAEHKVFPEAQAAFERAAQIDSTSFAAAYNLGRVYLEAGNLNQAREALTRSVAMNPASFQAHSLLGITLLRLGEKREGMAQFEKAEMLEPKNVNLLKLLATQCSEVGLHEEAITLLHRVLETGGAEPGVYLLLVEAYSRAGNDIPALDAARESVQKFPGSPRLNFVLGVRLQALGRFEESTPYFEKSIVLDPSLVEGYVALGELASMRGEHQAALSFFSKALTLRPDYMDASLGLADNYRKLGDLAHAERVLEEALLKDPRCPRCHLLLSQIYVAKKEFAKSEREKELFVQSRHKAQQQ
jgi:tetratricopeptide (TPR) repeat protein